MLTARVAIVGGGLSGLYAAALLEERGIRDYVLLEARDAPGGRILSLPSRPGHDRYDLGATWFWPALQPDLERMVQALGLETFEQYEDGDMLLEQSRSHAPHRVDGYRSAPAALRVAGGMEALIDALRQRLAADRLVTGRVVRGLRHVGECIEVEADDGLGHPLSCRAAQVLLAVPPRLAASTIEFTPSLPDALALKWQGCATWMAPHAKYLAVFDRPFWRDQGLSGEARSAVGPMAEIHDASAPGGHGALFGFLGVPAAVRHGIPEADLLAHCRAQLVHLFGEGAQSPRAEFLKDWAADPHVAVAADLNPGEHQAVGLPSMARSGAWSGQLVGIASEWSPEFPGYVAGAVDAARRGVEAVQ
ncbi:flavin monoamine oxidase family protein [Alicycliphilus denitrificans]|uniref:flavin monoamine oxidase family protein n=1 Tax=Alicycliphilus denitrificans TaxID=179636 RepID=UPI003A7FAE8D